MDKHPLDWNAKLVTYFINNSRLVWLLIFSFLIGGIFSLKSLRREGFPVISPKVVLVQTLYPGAASSEVESQVTKEIESGLKDVKQLKNISSTSANSFSNVIVTLEESADLDQSIQEIQSKVQSVRSDLPSEAETPKVTTFNTSGPSFIFAVTESGNLNSIREDAQTLTDEIEDVAGIKSAKLLIDRTERVTVAFRPADVTDKGVSLTTLTQALQAANVNFPAGRLDISNKEQSIVSAGAIMKIDDIKKVIVGVIPGTNQPILLQDVADVKPTLSDADSIERFGYIQDGGLVSSPGVLVSVEVTGEADIITTRDAVWAQIEKKKSEGALNPDLVVETVADQAQSTADQVQEIIEAAFGAKHNLWLLGGIQLLFIAILLFVNWQSALIAALAIPLSMAITFISLRLAGVQLNTIVLFSFILVLGLIVDPAIVMIEAIQRYRDLKLGAQEAVVESGRRYGASLFMAVLTSLIVFLPFAVVSGIFGQIIKYIPLTVIPALIASYFVPMALLPTIAQRILKPRKDHEHVSSNEEESLSRLARAVMRLNAWILSQRWRQVMILFLSFIFVGLSIALVATGKVQIVQFSTPEDNPNISVKADFTKGAPFEARDAAAKNIETAILNEAAVKQYYYYDQNRDSVTIMLNLKDKSERPAESEKSKAVVARLRNDLTNLPNVSNVLVGEVGTGPPESDYQIQTQLYDNDAATLESAAKTVGAQLSTLEHVTKVDDGFTNRSEPEIKIVLDRDKTQTAGLSSLEVGQQLKALLDETKLTQFEDTASGSSRDVYLVNASKPAKLDDIRALTVESRTGAQIKIGDIALVEQASVIDAIQRFDGARYVNVRARVDDQKNVLAVQAQLDSYLTDDKIKELGLDSRANRGDADDIAKSFQELGIALAVAILLTYIVLVLQFKSFSQPGIMLFTIPLSFIGVFPALWLTKSNLGFLELLGVTILVGIVENVAIFLMDYANQLKSEKNMTSREAIIQASGVRFRPILLTKLVALGGLLPLAIESDFWRGLSVVIIAGIGLSGFFSLVVIPILYVWINGARDRLHRPRLKHKLDI